MAKLEKTIYSPWAYMGSEGEKARINQEIYNEIKDKAKVKYVGSSYANRKYEVINNPDGLTDDELALICDGGNLCFGYRMEGGYIVIHTD